MTEIAHLRGVPHFFDKAIKELANGNTSYKILDFGSGAGKLIQSLRKLGYEAYGCDINPCGLSPEINGYLKPIEMTPYRLPYEDNSFDIVVSTSVLEHALNTEECFQEIHRVLKPGGHAMHILPSKWYLPTEPHIFVPLVNWFWPHCPKWWLALWAILGKRNSFQIGQPWKSVYLSNIDFCRDGLCYHTRTYYEKLSLKIFGHYAWPMKFFLHNSEGGFSALYHKLPFKNLMGKIFRDFRMGFLVTKKEMD